MSKFGWIGRKVAIECDSSLVYGGNNEKLRRKPFVLDYFAARAAAFPARH